MDTGELKDAIREVLREEMLCGFAPPLAAKWRVGKWSSGEKDRLAGEDHAA